MKIGEYEQMMAYLTRPGFKDGTQKIVEPPKSMQVDTTTKGISLDGPLMPEPKPYTSEQFKLKADLYIKGALGGFDKDEMIGLLQKQLDKVQESGTMEKEEAIKFIKDRAKFLKNFIKENPGETLPDLGRENFRGGTNPKIGQGFQKGNILGVKENITERNKKLVEEKNKKVLRTKELIKAGDTPAEAKKKVIKEFNLDRDPKAGTPRWLKQAKEELTNEGFKFTASKPGPENVGGKEKATKKREQVIGEGKTFESRLKKEKTKTGFGKKFETAHTANIFQAKKLGIDYPVDALAIQATNVNQEVAEILNDELKPLYKKQLNLVNKLKKNNTFALRKELDDINFKISETVATGGKQGNKAANVLKPIIVDPQNLKGKILDLGFKTSDEVLTLPGATTKGTKAGTIDDLMARMNIKENVLQKAKDLKKPDKAKTRDMFKDFEIRTKMTGPELDANRALLRGIGETLKAVPTPTGTLAVTAGFGVDPTSTIDRVALEAEAALAPELVKQTSRLTSNPIVQRFFNLGLSPANAMRVARAAQPLGVASLIGEGLYELGKRGVAEKAKLDAMTPFQKQQYLAGEIEPLMDEGGMVDISRDGFDEGGPSDPSKRKFMKVMGGLTALPFVGKFFKIAEPVAPAVVEGAKSAPPYFFKLVDKIKKFGEDATKQLKGAEREQVTVYRTSDADYELYEDLNTGSQQIKIRKGDPDVGYKEQELTLTKGQSDESAGVVPDDYDEYTVRPDNDGKLKDIEEGLDDIDDLIDELGPENISVKELQDMGYDVDRLGPVTKKKLGIK